MTASNYPTVETPVDQIKPYESNPRRIGPTAVAKVAASIEAFGFKQPIVVDKDGVIIVGHTRLEAAKHLGLKTVPVHVAENLSPEQAKAYRIADNRTNQESTWDDVLLAQEIGELSALGDDFDFVPLGFDEEEIANILHEDVEGNTDPDAVPDSAPAITKPGDIWHLGKHRLICGDCTIKETVDALLQGVEPHLMVTDPPYGVEYDPEWHVKAAADGKIKGAGRRGHVGLVKNDERTDWTDAYSLFPGDVAYVWHASIFGAIVADGLRCCKFDIRSQIVWAKASFAIGRGHYHWQHETCWYAVKKGRSGSWVGDRSQSTVWKVDKQTSETGHSTQKPVECMKRPIENNSNPGQAVYDPFLGSGTTLIAAEMTGRICYGIEIEPQYCDIIARRWMMFTGEQAKIFRDGKEVEIEKVVDGG